MDGILLLMPVHDSTHVVINEMAARELGFTEPHSAVGEQLISPDLPRKKYEIIGIIKDFNLNLKERPEGEIFYKHYLSSYVARGDHANEYPAYYFLVKLSTVISAMR